MKMQLVSYLSLGEAFEVAPFGSNNTTISALKTLYELNYTIGQTSLIEDLFKKLINEYYKWRIIEIDDYSDTELLADKKKEWLIDFINFYEHTHVYYETLIGLYNTNLSKLLDDVASLSTNEIYVNDTPQNDGGVFKATDYTSNYTKTTNSATSEVGTKMMRIKEVQDFLRDIWHDWIMKAREIFIERQGGEVYYG